MYVELDDVHDYNEELANAIIDNTRRYSNLVSDLIFELLPKYKEREVGAKDALDVYIEHRRMMESRIRQPNEAKNPQNQFPDELMRRLYVI